MTDPLLQSAEHVQKKPHS